MFGKSARKSKKESASEKSRIILDKSFKNRKDRPVRRTVKKKNAIKLRKLSVRLFFKKHPLFIRRIGYFIFAVLVIGAAVYALLNHNYFNIKEVEYVSEDEFRYIDEAAFDSFRDDAIGKNYFKYELNTQVGKFSADNSIVKKAFGEKVFPDKLLINIEEREPMFTFLQNNNCLIVDDEAVLVEKHECNGSEAFEEGTETGESSENIESSVCKCLESEKYPTLIPVYLMNSYVDFENMGSSNRYLVRGFLNIRDILEEDYYVINSYVVLDQSCQVEAYKATETSTGKNTIFLFSLEDDLDIQSSKLKVILDYLGELDEYSVVDLRFERPVLQE